MWIFLRLILAVIGFAIRTLARGRKPAESGRFEGTPYTSRVTRRRGRTTWFEIGMPRATPTWIRFHRESAADRAFKAMGIANEIQTGDRDFDERVYVTCDHPHVATVLSGSQELRAAILDLFDAGYQKIYFDGSYVRVSRAAEDAPTDRDLRLLHTLWTAAWKLEDAPPSRLSDRFFWKALIVEGVIWSIAGYAIGALFEHFWVHEDMHVDRGAVLRLGVIVAAIAFGVLLLVIALWLRGSSRGHRVIVESALVLLLSLPVTGVQVVSDTNRSFDDAPPAISERTFSQCERREHRSRRRRRSSYTYHLLLDPTEDSSTLPASIEVTPELCTAATASVDRQVSIAIGPGAWGVPWFRWIRIGETTWTNPL